MRVTRVLIIDAYNAEGSTALILAVSKSRADMVKVLVDAKASLDEQNRNLDTALIVAASNGYLKLVRLLLNAGADSTLMNKQGKTAFDAAKESDYDYIVELLRGEELENASDGGYGGDKGLVGQYSIGHEAQSL